MIAVVLSPARTGAMRANRRSRIERSGSNGWRGAVFTAAKLSS
jgi:hypothetical protein